MTQRDHTVTARPLVLAAALLLAGCGEDGIAPDTRPVTLPRSLSQAEVALVDAGNGFAFDLFARLAAEGTAKNLFVSPLSASMALGMTMNGAAGETLDGMRSGLGFGELPMSEINAGYRSLMDLLRGLDLTVELDLANAIFHRTGFQVEAPFLEATRLHFDAAVEALDFSSPEAPVRINDWVAGQTRGRIERMVDPPIDPLTMMFLMNAVYFRGDWTTEFDPGHTTSAEFTRADGTRAAVPMMRVESRFPYTETEALQAVELPYGGGAFAMTLVLPRAGRSLDDLARSLDAGAWREVVEALREDDGTVRLPRFGLEHEANLNAVLATLGMDAAFDPTRADFTPMMSAARDVGLHVKAVKQKAFVEVNEAGTEAAAVTSVEVGVTCACGPFLFTADRPFLFAIRERLTGAILFVGLLHDPA